MGNSSSQPGKVEQAARLKTLNHSAQRLYFGKQTSCLDQYSICDTASGQPLFIVKSDLIAAKRRGKRTTYIHEANSQKSGGSFKEIASVTAIDSSSCKWRISLAIGQICDVKVGSINRKTWMKMTFKSQSSEDITNPQRTWTLTGDKVSNQYDGIDPFC